MCVCPPYLSMGVMMRGMAASPRAVVVHRRRGRGQRVRVPSRASEAAQRRLMVKPGMATEARLCQTKVSATATPTRVACAGSCAWAWGGHRGAVSGGQGGSGWWGGGWGRGDTHGGSSPALVDGVGGHVGGGHAVAGPHHRYRHQRAEGLAHLVGVTWGSGRGSAGSRTGHVCRVSPCHREQGGLAAGTDPARGRGLVRSSRVTLGSPLPLGQLGCR